MSDVKDWQQRWEQGRLGFHRPTVHPDLIEYQQRFLADESHTVLVPLCGKSLDLCWLSDAGHRVIGVELVEQAVNDYFSEQQLAPAISPHADFRRFDCGNTSILCGDIFGLDASELPPIDRIWDRAALVALPPERRAPYVATLRAAAAPGAVVLQNSFTYDQDRMSGPPFSVSSEEVHQLYDGCEIEILAETDTLATVPFKEAGHEFWLTSSYLIRLP